MPSSSATSRASTAPGSTRSSAGACGTRPKSTAATSCRSAASSACHVGAAAATRSTFRSMILAWSGAEWANFVDAIASIAVPIVIGVALVLYRKPIRDLIGRNREAKLPGVELKFDPPDPGAIQAVKRQLPRETALDEAETDAIEAPAAVSGGGRNEDHLAVEIRDLATRDVRV